jgi:hypothetical protein
MAKKDEQPGVGVAPINPVEPPPRASAREEKQDPTVVEHALATGHAKRVRQQVNFDGPVPDVPDDSVPLVFSPAHAVAAQLHGWAAHKMATGKEFRCKLADYEAAIKAGSAERINRAPPLAPDRVPRTRREFEDQRKRPRKRPPVQSTYAPHAGALSPFAAAAQRKSEVV